MKNIAILCKTHSPTVDAIIKQLESYNVSVINNENTEISDFDLVIGVGIEHGYKGLACHYSLLPAFEGEEPVRDAFIAGVKVTGITVYYNNPFRIIAQYPLLISDLSHFDEIEKQLEYLEQVIYPVVTEKYINNEPFDVQSLFKQSTCSGVCSSCKGCK